MSRPHAYATAARCRTCGAPVVRASRDVLGDIVADLQVDPTPLGAREVLACVVAGRTTYRYGVEAGRGWLGDARVTGRTIAAPDDVLPTHLCGYGFGLPYAAWWPALDGQQPDVYPGEPSW